MPHKFEERIHGIEFGPLELRAIRLLADSQGRAVPTGTLARYVYRKHDVTDRDLMNMRAIIANCRDQIRRAGQGDKQVISVVRNLGYALNLTTHHCPFCGSEVKARHAS